MPLAAATMATPCFAFSAVVAAPGFASAAVASAATSTTPSGGVWGVRSGVRRFCFKSLYRLSHLRFSPPVKGLSLLFAEMIIRGESGSWFSECCEGFCVFFISFINSGFCSRIPLRGGLFLF